MAFTFAHPAAVLPLQKQKKWFHPAALVLGSMAPDFEYFLYGKPFQVAGHTFEGMVTVNFPLLISVWVLYEAFVREAVLEHMPLPFWGGVQQFRRSPRYIRHFREALIFFSSAMLGMLTHLLWDGFTHQSGFAVQALPALRQSFLLFDQAIPVYKLLQHGSTMLGLLIIGGFLFSKHKGAESSRTIPCNRKRIRRFWFSVVSLALFFMGLFRVFAPNGGLGAWVMQVLDSLLASLLAVSIANRLHKCGFDDAGEKNDRILS